MAKGKMTKAQERPLSAAEDKLVKGLQDDFGIDPQVVLLWLVTYGPKIVEMVYNWFKKKQSDGVQGLGNHCCDEVKKEAAAQVSRLQEALAAAICLDHCLNHCGEDESDE